MGIRKQTNPCAAPLKAAAKVLVVEDDPKIRALLAEAFRAQNFQVAACDDGAKALAILLADRFDLILADVMLPGLDGFSLVARLRQEQILTPVLFLSAKHSIEDRVEGLRLGGDDYVVKPFSLSEVLARAEAILRRACRAETETRLAYRDLEVDTMARKAYRGGVLIELHPKEFTLLECLMRNQEKILSKSQILEKVWKYDFEPQTNVVDVLVCRLRNKVDRGFEPKVIKTVRGVGYALKTE